MPKIKHLAIRTEDTGKLAAFYMDVFEMQMLHKDKREGGEAIVEKMKKINYNKLPKPRPDGRPYAEVRGSDPDGNYFDVSEHGFLKVEPVGEPKAKTS